MMVGLAPERKLCHTYRFKEADLNRSFTLKPIIALNPAHPHLELLVPRLASPLLRNKVPRVLLPFRNRLQALPIRHGNPQPFSRRLNSQKTRLRRGELFHSLGHLSVATVSFCTQGSKYDRVVGCRGCQSNRHPNLRSSQAPSRESQAITPYSARQKRLPHPREIPRGHERYLKTPEKGDRKAGCQAPSLWKTAQILWITHAGLVAGLWKQGLASRSNHSIQSF